MWEVDLCTPAGSRALAALFQRLTLHLSLSCLAVPLPQSMINESKRKGLDPTRMRPSKQLFTFLHRLVLRELAKRNEGCRTESTPYSVLPAEMSASSRLCQSRNRIVLQTCSAFKKNALTILLSQGPAWLFVDSMKPHVGFDIAGS